jgi:hydroxyacylglutathione hydrolase
VLKDIYRRLKAGDMSQEITTIGLKFMFVSVNCYLIKVGDSYILIDTGFSLHRRSIERELNNAGCRPGNLRLIIVTHADFDHIGNCAYLREKYGARTAMHRDESGVAEHGDMLGSRPGWPRLIRAYTRFVFLYLPIGKSKRFKPDIYLEDGQDLSEYGWDARIVHLPGHTSGSIGVLTEEGDIFCGDLLLGNRKPKKNSLVDNTAEMDASIERLKSLGVRKVYPGHGKPFKLEELV